MISEKYIRELAFASCLINIHGDFRKNNLGYRIDRSKYQKEVILKMKLAPKSFLCIFNFVGPGYFTIMQPLGIRVNLLYILIISDIKYSWPTKLNMLRRDL